MPNNNITELQLLRGTSGSNAAYVGLPGVLTADMDPRGQVVQVVQVSAHQVRLVRLAHRVVMA